MRLQPRLLFLNRPAVSLVLGRGCIKTDLLVADYCTSWIPIHILSMTSGVYKTPCPAEQLLLDKAGSLHVIGCISTQEQRVESPHLSVYFTRLKGLITYPGDLAQSSNSPPVQGGRSRGRGSSWHLSWRLGSRLGGSTVRTWLPNNSCVLRLGIRRDEHK